MLRILLDDNTDNIGGGTPSAPQGDNGQDSPTGQQDDNQSTDGQAPPTDDGSAPSDAPTGDEPAGDQPNDQQDGDLGDDQSQEPPVPMEVEQPIPDALVDKPGDEKLRFSDHPRWKEIVAEKNEYKQRVQESQSAVEQTNALNSILQQHAIPVQEFQAALQYLILKRNNPQEAFRQISRDYEVLGQVSGAILPPDLQAEVAAGTLTEQRAKQIAQAQAQQQYQQWQQQTQGQIQSYGLQAQVQQTTASWTSLKQSVDPDFKPGTKLWQTVDMHLRAMPAPQNAMQAQLNCENAYKQAKEYLKGFAPAQRNGAQPPRRPGQPPSRPSSPTNRVVVKTTADAINAIKSGGGKMPANIRYS